MNAQELRNLQEAYMEVYEERKERNPEKILRQFERHRVSAERRSQTGDTQGAVRSAKRYSGMKNFITTDSRRDPETTKRYQDAAKKVFKPKTQKEEVDIYDIILSHLLDEGYAETQQAAEAIMVNMSEEWRESICEAEIEPPKEKVGALTNIDIPMSEREAARQRTLAKAKAMKEKKKN
jgi:hypothetical protein